jgi:hypothetical protein
MRASSKAPARAFALAIVIAAITAAAYFMLVKAPREVANNLHEMAREIGKEIDNVIHFRPRITSGGVTLLKKSASINELSTTQRTFDYTHTWESTWLGSRKRIELKGSFTAKAGYDLTQPFSIDIAKDGKTIRAHMPPAKIHSVEQLKVEVLKDEDGLWNKKSTAEREQAMNDLLRKARESIEKSDILEQADKAFMAQLEEAIRKSTPPGIEILRAPLY